MKTKPVKEKRPLKVGVKITPPKFERGVVEILGSTEGPYVQHRFSEKARRKMEEVHAQGSQAKSRTIREPRNPKADYEAAMYLSNQGWHGIPAHCFRNALISACKIVGFQMTKAKLSLFVEPDGHDRLDATPLVRIYGDPTMRTDTVRNDNGSADIRYRPQWNNWTAKVKLRWDTGQFSLVDVMNLMARVGMQVGIGEGRPDSKNSAGLGWGLFKIAR
jgi:hypothetical protein